MKRVTQADLLDKVLKLRYDVYCAEMRYLDPANYPDKKESDKYDSHAFHFAAVRGDEVIASLRLIPQVNGKFLMEEYFVLPPVPRDKTLEASRCIVAKKFRGSTLYLYLLKCAYLFSVANGYNFWCGTLTKPFVVALKRDRWLITCVGDFADYHNSESVPFFLELAPEKVNILQDTGEISVCI